MRVWIENPFDNLPAEGFRPQRYWLMAQAFARAGHDVTLWTSDFSHATKRRRVFQAGRACDDGSGIDVVLIPSVPYGKNVSLKRLYSHWHYARAWWRLALARVRNQGAPDLIIASSPPLGAGRIARLLARRFRPNRGTKLVIDVMDAWPETFERVAPKWLLSPLKRLARANYLAADLITTVAERYIDLVRGAGYSGPVQRFYHGIEPLPSGARTPGPPGVCRLAYIGNLGRTYDLRTVLKALDKMPRATLDIAGRGDQEEALKAFVRDNGLAARVRCHGYLGDQDLARLLGDCDIGVVPMCDDSCVGVPYKFADYARAGLAIVSSLGGESAGLLTRYGAGACYTPHDPQSFANAVSRVAGRLAETQSGACRLAALFDAPAIYAEYVRMAERLKI